jgi:hypothetical protein
MLHGTSARTDSKFIHEHMREIELLGGIALVVFCRARVCHEGIDGFEQAPAKALSVGVRFRSDAELQ